MNSKKISIFTLGCKVNLYDSDAMLAVFRHNGFEVAEGLEKADIYILNTCAVTAEAEKKSRQAIARIKTVNPDAVIYVCGCASQRDRKQFEKDGVVEVIGTDGKIALARRIVKKYRDLQEGESDNIAERTLANCPYDGSLLERRKAISDAFEEGEGVVNFRTRHFIKVQDGCDNFCSYCIVPYLRGKSRSRSIDSVIEEFDGVSADTREVVVSGVNLSAYGAEWGGSLADLIVALQKYDLRIRLGSLEVGVIDEKLLDALCGLKRFCPHFHLSLQSGDDSVLKAMNRHYTSAEYMRAVQLIRSRFSDPAITTDIIVGFPTEGEEEFQNSLNFATQVAFSDIHVFPYSSREGTVAGRMKPISPNIMELRRQRMAALKEQLISAYISRQIGRPLEVLYESFEDGYFVGHTPNYVKLYSPVGERNRLDTLIPVSRFRDGLLAAPADSNK